MLCNLFLLLIYFIHSSSYLLIPCPIFPLHPFLHHSSFFFIFLSLSLLLYSLVCCIIYIPHISDIMISYSICLSQSDLFHLAWHPLDSACNVGDLGSIPGLGRSPGEGDSYPLQYCILENPMDYIVHRGTKSWTRLSNFH